jgi:hypothetical protein
MKEFAVLGSILWRAVVLFPLALVFFLLVVTYLFLPVDLVLYAVYVSSWYWITLPIWMASVYLLRAPIRNYFRDVGKSWL